MRPLVVVTSLPPATESMVPDVAAGADVASVDNVELLSAATVLYPRA
jgi:hypothetical protein